MRHWQAPPNWFGRRIGVICHVESRVVAPRRAAAPLPPVLASPVRVPLAVAKCQRWQTESSPLQVLLPDTGKTARGRDRDLESRSASVPHPGQGVNLKVIFGRPGLLVRTARSGSKRLG